MELTEKLADALKANKVNGYADLRALPARGYASDACQDFSAEIVDSVRDLLVYAINAGAFKREVKAAIEALIDLAGKLDDKKAPAKLIKYREDKDRIVAGVRRCEEDGRGLKERVLRYIDTSLDAAAVVLKMGLDEGQQARLIKSVYILGALKETVAGVWDDCSADAGTRARAILDALNVWREELSVYICSTPAVDSLERARAEAEAWDRLVTAPGRHVADEKFIDEHLAYRKSTVDRIIQSEVSYERLLSFGASLDRYEQITRTEYATDGLEAERDAARAHLAVLRAEIDDATEQYRSGALSAEEADDLLTELEDSLAEREEFIQELDEQIRDKAAARRSRAANSREFARLNRAILEHKSDPAMLYTLSSHIDFVDLCNALLGRMSSDEIRDVVEQIIELFYKIKAAGGINDAVRDSFREIREVVRAERTAITRPDTPPAPPAPPASGSADDISDIL